MKVKKIGYIGLGKMGYNQVLRLLEKGYEVVAYNRSSEPVEKAVKEGAFGVATLKDLAMSFNERRVIWIMVPYKAVEDVLDKLKPHLSTGDIIIDGGNSPYKDTMRRAKELEECGVSYLDCGVSCGPYGARNGAALMIGGKREVYNELEQLFVDLSSVDGYAYLGRSGAGHFVKMVHNGIEYGMMQAIAEGFDIIKNSEFNLSFKDVMRPYQHCSVIESKLITLLSHAFEKYGDDLEPISGSADASGEGKWTVEVAHSLGVEDVVIHNALRVREKSLKNPSFQGKIIQAMRGEFGGHPVLKKEKNED